MNKYKESLGIILNKLPSVEKVLCKEYITELQELVDKETPIKVKPYPELKKYFNVARCSKCKRVVEIDDIYCRECGQKLDWSDE